MQEASDGQVKEGQQDVRPTGAGAAASDWLGPIKPDDKEELRQVWEHLKETVEALPHVGCYSIASVAYRRQAQCPTVLCLGAFWSHQNTFGLAEVDGPFRV